MGKKVMITTTAALDCQSKPNHITMIGAMPTIGSAENEIADRQQAALEERPAAGISVAMRCAITEGAGSSTGGIGMARQATSQMTRIATPSSAGARRSRSPSCAAPPCG
jgi:hypothetical protein